MAPSGTFSTTTREPSDRVQADPLLVWSDRKQRYYRRKFDHDEARALYVAGASLPDLCERYGVTDEAIRYAVLPGRSDASKAYSREWRTTVCESCGGPAMKLVGSKAQHNRDGRILCLACRSRVRRKPIRYGDGVVKVECGACTTWKPLEAFPPRVTRALAAGKAVKGRCRACDTAERRRYREAHKIPCERCGQPCLPPGEKGAGGASRALCRDCYHASGECEAALARGRTTALAERRVRAAARRASRPEVASPRKGSEA